MCEDEKSFELFIPDLLLVRVDKVTKLQAELQSYRLFAKLVIDGKRPVSSDMIDEYLEAAGLK